MNNGRCRQTANYAANHITNYDIIIFDADGTILDFFRSQEEALASLYAHFGLPYSASQVQTLYEDVNHCVWAELERGEIRPEDLSYTRFERFAAKAGLAIAPDILSRIYLEALGNSAHYFSGAEELLAKMADVLPLVLLTNGLADVQRSRFHLAGVDDYFRKVVISGEAGVAKPEPEAFRLALSDFESIDPKRVLMVGDSLSSDIEGAGRFGIRSCWFNPAGKPNNTDGVKPDYEIRDYQELEALVFA